MSCNSQIKKIKISKLDSFFFGQRECKDIGDKKYYFLIKVIMVIISTYRYRQVSYGDYSGKNQVILFKLR